MSMRGVRGATTIIQDHALDVLNATQELLLAILEANPGLQPEDIASAWFTTTPDISSAYPAKAARQLGWNFVPLMCAQEISIQGGLPYCIRVLIHLNTSLSQAEIHHVYLHDAAILRPDLVQNS
jgi:chorismate mutase